MFTIEEINNAVKGELIHNNYKEIDNISINSNDIKNNTIFVPILGEKFDGHEFILSAIKNGCIAVFMSSNYSDKDNIIDECIKSDVSVIEIDDTLKALQDLAHYNRIKNKNTKVIAITGSNGKTSTKDLIYDILKYDYDVLKTEGNLNNHIGLPLTLLKLNNHDICILEMGMNHFGEIETLSNIAEPDIAIITNIGTAHIGILGSKDNILKAKMEITSGLKENGLLFINNEDEYLNRVGLNSQYTTFKYGFSDSIKKLKLSKVGEFPINVVLAYEISKVFNIKFQNFKKYLKLHKTPKMRMEKIKIKNNIIINDCYNANYDSMKPGIENIIKNYGNKNYHILLYLGDMLELGEWSPYYHKEIGKLINSSNIDVLYVSGNDVKYILEEAKDSNIIKKQFKINSDNSDIIDNIINDIKINKKNLIYFKASRGIGLDRIVDELLIRLTNEK